MVDGNRLKDGRELPSPPSDSEEVDEAAAEEGGRRWKMGGMLEVVDNEVGMTESSALAW